MSSDLKTVFKDASKNAEYHVDQTQMKDTHIKDTNKVTDQVDQTEKKDNKNSREFGSTSLSFELKDKPKDIQEKGNKISGKKTIKEKSINNFLILLSFYKFIMRISNTI